MELRSRWAGAWQSLGAAPDPRLLDKLLQAYGEPHRHYHTVRHLEECFTQFDLLKEEATRPEEVEVALWFHDAIYDLRRSDNEVRSAQFAFESLQGASPGTAEKVRALVMATRHDALPESNDARILVDVDLSILGASKERFDEYEAQVRAEYAWVPRRLYRRARRKILQEFLAWPKVFSTARFAELYEARARKNLARSLARL